MKSRHWVAIALIGLVTAFLALACDTGNSAIGSQADAELAAKVIGTGSLDGYHGAAANIVPAKAMALGSMLPSTLVWDDGAGGTVSFMNGGSTTSIDPDFNPAYSYGLVFTNAHITHAGKTYVLDGTVSCTIGLGGSSVNMLFAGSGISIEGPDLSGTCGFDFKIVYNTGSFAYDYSGTIGGKSVSGSFTFGVS